ncbi:uncharacterized protein LOC115448889 isoform X2 [Manduca sexta]|uniref:uncharacterized protein LOC115448889 isoform X2 n=1 Tax=Manduca sexta TaxID=7130 RepID=UPI00188F0C3E|nr:uncharacterized protein LOC115448889 isoform X2 [Manduca sexta]
MLVNRAMQFAVLTAAVLWENRSEAAAKASVKFCGRHLSEIMSRVCHAYNGPTVEQPGPVVRRRRQLGIADECCIIGCTWEQLSEYCSISAYSESPLEDLETHIISDRSAEQEVETMGGARTTTTAKSVPTLETSVRGPDGMKSARREVGRARSRGYGRARGHGCWCRRKRRPARRRTSVMGNMGFVKSAARAAPVVGTVSPLITWGRTLNTDLPIASRDRYAYIVYA